MGLSLKCTQACSMRSCAQIVRNGEPGPEGEARGERGKLELRKEVLGVGKKAYYGLLARLRPPSSIYTTICKFVYGIFYVFNLEAVSLSPYQMIALFSQEF